MAASGIKFHRIWIEQCAAGQRIKQRFGLGNALEYLVGEKLLNFVEAAEHNPLFAQELPSFVAEIKQVFSLAEVSNYALRIERTKRLSLRQRAAIRAISSYRRKYIRLFKAGFRNQSSVAALPCSTVWYLLGSRAPGPLIASLPRGFRLQYCRISLRLARYIRAFLSRRSSY